MIAPSTVPLTNPAITNDYISDTSVIKSEFSFICYPGSGEVSRGTSSLGGFKHKKLSGKERDMAISNARVGIANGKLLLQLSLEYQLVLVVESPCIERRICR